VRVLEYKSDGNVSYAKTNVMGDELSFAIPAPGRHSIFNALIVVMVARILQFDLAKVAEVLKVLRPLPGRGAHYQLKINGKRIRLIDDAYNANPTSMRAGLAVLSQQSGRKIAVLGEMGELGENSPIFHESLNESVREAGVDLVFASGKLMQHLYTNLPESHHGAYKMTADELVEPVISAIQDGDNVFIKGSKTSEVSKVVQALISQSENQEQH
jgi:UDP-N-acetylmuramoyl-tripeptide--D-alanyl-D-alanine ligase